MVLSEEVENGKVNTGYTITILMKNTEVLLLYCMKCMDIVT